MILLKKRLDSSPTAFFAACEAGKLEKALYKTGEKMNEAVFWLQKMMWL